MAEMLVSTLIIAFVLVELRIQNVDAMESFRRAKDNLSGTWMANTLINELMAEELPNFDADDDNEQNRGYLSGNGTFESFLADAYPEVHGQMGEKRLELFKQWTYTWTKEVVLINEKAKNAPTALAIRRITAKRPLISPMKTLPSFVKTTQITKTRVS